MPLYAHLNLLNRSMQMYNLDESGITNIYKPVHVITKVKHKSVGIYFWREREDAHTFNMCFSIREGPSTHDDFPKEKII